MNKSLYRLLFNRALGLVMVVAETARAEGKPGGTRMRHASRPRALLRLRPLCWSLLMALSAVGMNAAQAQTPPAMQIPQIPQVQPITLPQLPPMPNTALVEVPSLSEVGARAIRPVDVNAAEALRDNSARTATVPLDRVTLPNGLPALTGGSLESSLAPREVGVPDYAARLAQARADAALLTDQLTMPEASALGVSAGDGAVVSVLDSSALGGMYQGRIVLVNGGVNSVSELGAGAGEIVLGADGILGVKPRELSAPDIAVQSLTQNVTQNAVQNSTEGIVQLSVQNSVQTAAPITAPSITTPASFSTTSLDITPLDSPALPPPPALTSVTGGASLDTQGAPLINGPGSLLGDPGNVALRSG
ncbi:MAG: ESPR domain-containing protein, partial [Pseudomonadales bacterium]|nr:ESPR domain-containing protein [Pseudomonadales bacterium]